MKHLLLIIVLFSCSKTELPKTEIEGKLTINAPKNRGLRAPDMSILGDESWWPISHGAFQFIETYWKEVKLGDYLNDVYKIQPGMKLIMKTNCPIVNMPEMQKGRPKQTCDYAWIINKQTQCYQDTVNNENECGSMLAVEVTRNDTLVGFIEKTTYRFLSDCHADHIPCVTCPDLDRKIFMIQPAWSVDFYFLYTDITDLIPLTGTSEIVVTPTVNFRRIWIEQNYNNNSLDIPITLLPDAPYARFTNQAL